MKASAIAHSNIALIKYWGRSANFDPHLNIPANDTVSMTKIGASNDCELKTHTTIEFSPNYYKDFALLEDSPITGRNFQRILNVINPLRKLAQVDCKFKMISVNDFPTQAGLASSASAFAALTMAAVHALNLSLSSRDISTYARLGSGSAARSILGGFVYCYRGTNHQTAFAEKICEAADFDMNAVLAIVDDSKKKVTSDIGHEYAATSPFNEARIQMSHIQAQEIRRAIKDKDFTAVGTLAEDNCKYMHTVMMTAHPPLFYWSPTTLRIIKAVQEFRESGLECYFTIDAGPNVHCLCRLKDIRELENKLKHIDGIQKTIVVKPASDPYITDDHLF